MLLMLLAAQVVQPIPMIPPVQRVATSPIMGLKLRKMDEARTLLDRADGARLHYGRGGGSKVEFDSQRDQLKAELDNMSDLTETDSMRLQMAMDRLTKLMSVLSNLLNKMGDTQGSITNNIK